MDVLKLLAERRIEEAMQEGVFDNLTLKGRRLDLSESPWTDPEWRVGLKVLKNAGVLPPEMQLRKEIADLRGRVRHCIHAQDLQRLHQDLEERRVRYRILMGY